MVEYSSLLLELYRASREMSAAEFPDFAFELSKSTLRFDSARLLTVEVNDNKTVVHGSYVHNEPIDTVIDWEEITRHDTVLKKSVSRLGSAISFNAPSLYTAPEEGAIRDYAAKYGHQNGLVVVRGDKSHSYLHGMSLYRAHKHDHYSEQERNLMECLAPHVVEALKINNLIATQPVNHSTDRVAIAFARADGNVATLRPWFRQADARGMARMAQRQATRYAV